METTHCVFHDPISVKQSYKIFHFSFFTYIGDFSLFTFHFSFFPFPLMGVSLF